MTVLPVLTPEQAILHLKPWNEASDQEKISLYKQAKEPVRQLYLRSISYFSFPYMGLSSPLVEFFGKLHDSPCDYCEGSDEKCIASPWQQNTFRLMGLDRTAILANDFDLNCRKGWVRLITSLKDEDILAKVVIEIRYEIYPKKLLKGMETNARKRILERISKLQTDGYPTLDRDSWFRVATPTFNSVYGVCKKGYEDGDTMINKTCGVHTSHIKCAEEKWGERRIDWLATPCQLCTELGY